MATKKEGAKTERVNVWLLPEQVEWLKGKKNVSQTMRALVTEAMNLEKLALSVRKGAATSRAAKPSSPRRKK